MFCQTKHELEWSIFILCFGFTPLKFCLINNGRVNQWTTQFITESQYSLLPSIFLSIGRKPLYIERVMMENPQILLFFDDLLLINKIYLFEILEDVYKDRVN